jgi:hypothetical protein
MQIQLTDTLDPARLDDAWTLYGDAFEELRYTAVQRHLMYRSEFDDMMADGRIQKYLALDSAGSLVGLSTYTNQLDSMPLISPDYFARRWPQQYAAGRIWYVGFVAVRAGARGTGVFLSLVGSMYRTADNGVIALDICRHNEQEYGLPAAVHKMLDRLSGGARSERLDAQSYWAYEFPANA